MRGLTVGGCSDPESSGQAPTSPPEIAVFLDPLSDTAGGLACANVDTGGLLVGLSRIDAYAGATHRGRAIHELVTLAGHEADKLAPHIDAVAADDLEPRSPAQRYFRIRTGALTPEQAWWHILRVIRHTARDLMEAPLAGSDLSRLCTAIAEVIRRASGESADKDLVPTMGSRPAPQINTLLDLPHEDVYFRRWIIAHQTHAMLNVYAADALREATAALRAQSFQRATAAIESAARIVDGFAAARAHALGVPPEFYERTLRPTMLPPLSVAPLSGRMHVEYSAYRAALETLLEALPMSCAELAVEHPSLALARERLLEADLIDAERHVTSVEPLVGSDRSLVQTSKSTDNAVSVLRRIRNRRSARAAPFVRFTDADTPGQQPEGDGDTTPRGGVEIDSGS